MIDPWGGGVRKNRKIAFGKSFKLLASMECSVFLLCRYRTIHRVPPTVPSLCGQLTKKWGEKCTKVAQLPTHRPASLNHYQNAMNISEHNYKRAHIRASILTAHRSLLREAGGAWKRTYRRRQDGDNKRQGRADAAFAWTFRCVP